MSHLGLEQLSEVENYGIPITHFDAITLDYGCHGLCLPGLAYRLYIKCGNILFKILRKVFPSSDRAIQAQIDTVADDSTDGYELLWAVTQLIIPIFDITQPVILPRHTQCIHRNARLYLTHQKLSFLRGTKLSAYKLSQLFLQNCRTPYQCGTADTRLVGLAMNKPTDSVDGTPEWECTFPLEWTVKYLAKEIDKAAPKLTKRMNANGALQRGGADSQKNVGTGTYGNGG